MAKRHYAMMDTFVSFTCPKCNKKNEKISISYMTAIEDGCCEECSSYSICIDAKCEWCGAEVESI